MRCIPEECASLNNMSGMCTHILSAVSYVCVSRVRFVLSSSSPCETIFVFFGKVLNYLVNVESCNKEVLSWLLKRQVCVGTMFSFNNENSALRIIIE